MGQTVAMRNRYGVLVVAILIALMMVAMTPGRATAQETHVIRYGDTLNRIAQRYGFSVKELVSLNGIQDPDLIISGEVLQLPTAAGDASAMSQGGPPAEVVEPSPADVGTDAADAEPVAEEVADVEPVEVPPYFPRETIRDLLIDAAHRYGWDPTLIMAQAWQESMWQQHVVSHVGAIGVMQVMPDTSASLADWYFGHELDTWNSAYDNINAGVAYLTMLYEVTGSLELALASYYQGWASVQRDGFFPDTEQYVDNIFAFQAMFMNGQLP